MLRHITVSALVALAATSAAAERPSLTEISDKLDALLRDATPMQFCGWTAATTNGAADGITRLDEICAAEFPGSRMCTAGEALDSFSSGPLPIQGFGWVRGQFGVVANPTLTGQPFVMVEQSIGFAADVTLAQIENQNCSQFNSDSGGTLGLIFGRSSPTFGARFFLAACSGNWQVSCCAPKSTTPAASVASSPTPSPATRK